MLLVTGCGPKSKDGETGGKVTEVTKSVAGMYYAAYDGAISYYNDFYELKEDGTFTRQSNFCTGYKTINGTYTVEEKDGAKTITLKDTSKYYDKEFELVLNGDTLSLKDEKTRDDSAVNVYTVSCGSQNWLKGDATIVDRQADVSY